jgi:agmatinase
MAYNPDDVGVKNGCLFGIPQKYDDAALVILPVPWEVTVSYKAGTATAPQAILDASPQLDIYHPDFPDAWQKGMLLLDIPQDILLLNNRLRAKAKEYILMLEAGANIDDYPVLQQHLNEINIACNDLRKRIYDETEKHYNNGKKVAVLGGDHSTPLGLMQMLSSKMDFGILQIDAHADLRNAYEGFTYSHASVMYNAIQSEHITHLIQVGIRDVSIGEVDFAANHPKIKTFYDHQIKHNAFVGKSWALQVEEIIAALPSNVYISFDIDGLKPWLCPNTGTPVPGGLEFEQAQYLIVQIARQRNIVGFDLNEVSPSAKDEWDANVGARVLYQLCASLLK